MARSQKRRSNLRDCFAKNARNDENNMILFPAIDIKNGKVVRLLRGEFDKVTEYGQDPVAMARHWESEGARWLHVVDLDGAKDGCPANIDVTLKIAQSVGIPVQNGGGIRSAETVKRLIDGGVARVVLGTKAVEDLAFLKSLIPRYPDQIAVSLDCKGGYVTTHGWVAATKIKAVDFVKQLEDCGLKYLIYTDVATDGMLTGPNIAQLKDVLKAAKIALIASGGVSSLEDLKALKGLEKDGIIGAITGKAIYEKKFTIREALLVRSS